MIPPTREKAAVPFATAILAVWVVVVAASLFNKDYTQLSIVTPVMLLAAGFVFGIREKGKNGSGS